MNIFVSPFRKATLPLIALTFVYTIGVAFLASHGAAVPQRTDLLWRLAFALFMVRWVAIDRQSHKLDVPYEFNAFVFFAWVVVVPYYLFKTRGPRGIVLALAFWILVLIPAMVETGFNVARRLR